MFIIMCYDENGMNLQKTENFHFKKMKMILSMCYDEKDIIYKKEDIFISKR